MHDGGKHGSPLDGRRLAFPSFLIGRIDSLARQLAPSPRHVTGVCKADVANFANLAPGCAASAGKTSRLSDVPTLYI
jgi:hypothetical protein